jgi:hypothetical protein
LWVEQRVKRLRKPEGAAQPGEVSPVSVAAHFCKRRRAPNPMEGPPDLVMSSRTAMGISTRSSAQDDVYSASSLPWMSCPAFCGQIGTRLGHVLRHRSGVGFVMSG